MGTRRALAIAVRTTGAGKRHTALSWRLEKGAPRAQAAPRPLYPEAVSAAPAIRAAEARVPYTTRKGEEG